MVIEDVLSEGDDGRFALTPIGESLRLLRGAALVARRRVLPGGGGPARRRARGGTPFERVDGEAFFEHLDRDRDHEAAFEASMAGRADQEAHDVVATYDFGGLGRIVDVGGGRGVLLATILRAVPDCVPCSWTARR